MYSETLSSNGKKISAGKLVVGLVLLVVGVASFLQSADLWDSRSLWSYWPLILIAIGAANETDAIRRRKSDGSYVLLGIGVWMLAGSFGLFGLSWSEAFPLAIVVAGLGVLLHAIIDVPTPEKENNHEQQR
jgi:hypothetical protein